MEYFSELTASLAALDSSTVSTLIVHFASFPIALWFYNYRPPADSTLSRENVSSAIGVLLVILAYKWDVVQLFLQWILAYLLLKYIPKHELGKYTFMMTMGHVLMNHAYNITYHYGNPTAIDYTGTMMLFTMKLSSLAFAVGDSTHRKDKLTPMQQKYRIEHEVTLMQHFSYTFSFVGILFGPMIFFNDYRAFIEMQSKGEKSKYKLAGQTLLGGLLAVLLYLMCVPHYDVKRNYASDVLASGFLNKHWVLYVSMFGAKCKYYFVWLTAQSLSLYAGIGEDDPSITATVNPVQIELATSFKQFVDNWNIFASKWLRYAVYERVTRQKALGTFVVSAIWHGFYPGYLMMFVPLAFYSILGRKLHKVVRPKFQSSRSLRVIYALITWVGTTILVMFNGTGFQLLYYDKISQVQLGLFCYPHIIAALLFFIIPSSPRNLVNNHGEKGNGVHSKPHTD